MDELEPLVEAPPTPLELALLDVAPPPAPLELALLAADDELTARPDVELAAEVLAVEPPVPAVGFETQPPKSDAPSASNAQ